MPPAPSGRRPTNVSLPADLVGRARALGVNLSREIEAHLVEVVRQKERELWRSENAEALQAYAKYVEQHGVWNEDSRGW